MRIRISIPLQLLELYGSDHQLLRRYQVSTAKNGAGEQRGSYRTPRGRHLIRAKIGANQAENTVFVRRRPTGEVWTPELAANHPGRDWILTRILWLSGREPGFNRLGEVDTMRRYIYLHGSPDTAEMGCPGSIGCVRMRNRDIVELFDLVPPYTPVDIVEFGVEAGAWDELGGAARAVRDAVFVREQEISPAAEWDALDTAALHALAYGPAGEPLGTGRLLADGRIGRIAVMAPWRGKGVGTALLDRLVELAAREGMTRVWLHARQSAAEFYRHLGFVQQGEPFPEVGTPHLRMERQLLSRDRLI